MIFQIYFFFKFSLKRKNLEDRFTMYNVYSVLNMAAQIVDKTVEKFKPRIQITQQKKSIKTFGMRM